MVTLGYTPAQIHVPVHIIPETEQQGSEPFLEVQGTVLVLLPSGDEMAIDIPL